MAELFAPTPHYTPACYSTL